MNNKGDTIVEVIICIAIIGVVITGGYLAASRSTAAIRTAQDHQIASNITQSQIEILNDTVISSLPDTPFCFPYKSQTAEAVSNNTKCTNYSSEQTPVVYPEKYNVLITKSPATLNGLYTFKIDITWPQYGSISSQGTNSSTTYYQTSGK